MPPPRLRQASPLLAVLAASALAASAPAGEPPAPVAVPRLTHPGAGQTFYFVLTDRFANGRTDNDTGGYPGGADDHGFDPTRISHYHGGDFAGLTARLDYLQALGVTAVWVTPPFKNQPMQAGTAGYHGYWITDFLALDPHLGTNEEYREFIRQAQARGLRVYMDIIVNHTADIIHYADYRTDYLSKSDAPYRDAQGQAFDERTVAFNGLNDPAAFPTLSATRSFAHQPLVPPAAATAKHPAWLNDLTLYHNRGNSRFQGENSLHGDFAGLDDVFTEHPRVVQGFIDVFSHWLEAYGVDGFRIDTAKHVNGEFWQAFIPALRARARALGRPDFLQFGEVMNEAGDPAYLSEFSTGIPLDATLDFGFFAAARRFVSQGGTAAALADFFARDDSYTDHDSNVHATTTFLGNHDNGRFGYFLQQDNPGATPEQLAGLAQLGHGLLLLSRGQPVLYYGDEQGMIGRGGWDQQAREDMFAARAPAFRDAPLLGTTRTGADDKFDPQHPFYRLIARLGALRAAHVGLRTGAMLPRATADAQLFAFSRLERGEQVEYVVALNAARTRTVRATVPTSQPAGATLRQLFDSRTPEATPEATATVDEAGRLHVTLAPLQFAVWRAAAPLAPAEAPRLAFVSPAAGATLRFTAREVDGLVFPSRQELRAEVTGGDGVAEVTFALVRASRPGQVELLGTDDAAPYRIFWQPPPDLAPDERLTFLATVNDLRGHQSVAEVAGITVAPTDLRFGIAGAHVPVVSAPPATVALAAGGTLHLAVTATGTAPLEYQWLRDGEELPGATAARLATPARAGTYRVLVRNRAGTTLGAPTAVTVAGAAARLEQHPDFPSRFVAARQVDVWLPPGYDAADAGRYPVIYMHDGQNLFAPGTSYGGVPWSVDAALERLIATGRTRGAMVVGIWNTGATRFLEYMPQKPMTDEVLANYGPGLRATAAELRSDAYLQFLVTELKPWVDRTYRTRPDAAHTFVMGSSMGGLISAYALAEYPTVFGGAGCVSTHWPAGEGGVIDYLARHLPPPGEARLYFDHGTETLDASYEGYQREMDARLRAAGWVEGRDWITRRFPGAEHSERSWRDRVDLPLAFLLGDATGEPRP